MEVVIDQKGEETVIKIKGRLDTNTAPPRPGTGVGGTFFRGKGFAGMGESGSKSMCRLF